MNHRNCREFQWLFIEKVAKKREPFLTNFGFKFSDQKSENFTEILSFISQNHGKIKSNSI